MFCWIINVSGIRWIELSKIPDHALMIKYILNNKYDRLTLGY